MTVRNGGRLLWLASLMVLPLPMLGFDGSFVPVGRFAQLAAGLSILGFTEGADGIVGLFIALLWAHTVGFALLLFGGVSILRRLLAHVVDPARLGVLLAGLAVGLVVGGLTFGEYDSQFHHTTAHATLQELYR